VSEGWCASLGHDGQVVEVLDGAQGHQGDALLADHGKGDELSLRQAVQCLLQAPQRFLEANGQRSAQVRRMLRRR